MTPGSRDRLLEAANGAFRERDANGRIRPAPAWCDLSPEDREALFELQMASRAVEREFDRQGLCSTARAVLARIERSGIGS